MAIPASIERFLSGRFASLVILLLSIAGRIVQKLYFTGTGGDRAPQIQATKNLLEGNGLSLYEVVASNLSSPQYIPLIKWPPGYSILLIPFYNNDHYWGSIWLDILSVIIFVWLTGKMLMLFDVPVMMANLYTIVSGFFLYEFCNSNSTDLLAFLCFEGGLYLTLKWLLSTEKKYLPAIGISVLLFAGGLMRYMFIPVAFVIPAYLILSGIINTDKKLAMRGILMFSIVGLLVAALLFFQYSYGGSAAYVIPTEKGFYPAHFVRMNPFLFHSVMNMELANVQLEKITGAGYLAIGKLIRFLHFFIALLLLVFFITWALRHKLRKPTLLQHFIYINVAAAITTILLLIYLSLTNAPNPVMPSVDWTFVDEGRYYSILIIFFQQLLFIIAGRRELAINKNWYRFSWVCTMILLIATLHAVLFTTKMALHRKEQFYRGREEFKAMAMNRQLVKQLVTQHPGKQVIVAGGDPTFNNYAALWENVPGLEDYSLLDQQKINSTKETIILITIRDRDRYKFPNLLKDSKLVLVGQHQDYKFYTFYLEPAAR